MEQFFKSIIDMDIAPIVVCSLDHKIIYMNPAAAESYSKSGGYDLIGKSLIDCHNNDSVCKIERVIHWFSEGCDNNRVFTFHNRKQNKDVYMIALRNDKGELIGYYEKHEYRTLETEKSYEKINKISEERIDEA